MHPLTLPLLAVASLVACSGGSAPKPADLRPIDTDTSPGTVPSDTPTDTSTIDDPEPTETGDTGVACVSTTELGNDLASAEDLGTLPIQGSVCGDLDSTGWDVDGFTGDVDWLAFTPATSGVWEFLLIWTTASDFDFTLTDAAGVDLTPDQGGTPHQPELIYADLTAGETYLLQIGGEDGLPGDWRVTHHLTPLDPADDWAWTKQKSVAGTVDLAAETFSGVFRETFVGSITGDELCTWEWTVVDWQHDPAQAGPDPVITPCENSAGEPCDFDFTVAPDNGHQVGGTDCTPYFLGTTDLTIAIGYHPDADFLGAPAGATSMYNDNLGGFWIPMSLIGSPGTYDAQFGTFSMEFPPVPQYGF